MVRGPCEGEVVAGVWWSPEGPSSCLTRSLSSSERSASWSPPPQCHAVLAVISAWSTSFSSCLASAPPASALSMRMPAVRRWKNCCTDSPGRRVSMPETAFCRQSSWSSAEPGSYPSLSSSPSPSPPESEPEPESSSSSSERLGPDSCSSSVTRKEKSRAPTLPSFFSVRVALAAIRAASCPLRWASVVFVASVAAAGDPKGAAAAPAAAPAAGAPMPSVACNALSTGLVRKPPAMPIIADMGSLARAMAAATAPLSKAGSLAGLGSERRSRERLLERPRRSRPRSRDELRRRRSRSRRSLSREELRPRPRSRGDGLRRRRSRWSRRSRSLSRPRSLSRSRPLPLSRSLSLSPSLSRSLSLSLSLSRCLPSPLLSVVPPSGLVSVDGPPPCSKALPSIRGGDCWGAFLLSCCESKVLRSACSDASSCSGAASPPVGATTPRVSSPGTGGQEGATSCGAFELTSTSASPMTSAKPLSTRGAAILRSGVPPLSPPSASSA